MFDLPEKITKEFLDELEWREGPFPTYEISEMGLVRRPHGVYTRGIFPGFLYSPNLSIRRGPHYRLNPGANKSSVYLSPVIVMTEVFGEFRNKLLRNSEYVHSMKKRIVDYNSVTFREKKPFKHQREVESGVTPARRCCDCGAKTRNYRCDACWVVVRAKASGCDEPLAEFRILGGR